MDGDIEKEMKEVKNQPDYADMTELELPSMDDRMARTERVLRRSLNIREPSQLTIRLMSVQQQQHMRHQILDALREEQRKEHGHLSARETRWAQLQESPDAAGREVQEQQCLLTWLNEIQSGEGRLRHQRRQVDLKQMHLDCLRHKLNIMESELQLNVLNELRLNEVERQPWPDLQAMLRGLRDEQQRQQQVLTELSEEQERQQQRFRHLRGLLRGQQRRCMSLRRQPQPSIDGSGSGSGPEGSGVAEVKQ